MSQRCPYDHPKERLAFADSLDPERARATIGPMWREWATAQIKPTAPAGYRDCPECAEQEGAKP